MMSVRSIGRIGLGIAALACAVAWDATAQTFLGLAPDRPLSLPVPDGAGRPITTAPAVKPPALAAPRLRHLASHVGGLRFSGERDARDWTLTLTAREAREPATLQVGYVAAISVLPQGSTMGLTVNGVDVGRVGLEPPVGVRTARFAIPAGLLVRGANSLRLLVEQRHRVDCSPDASYELWTQIDPGTTGLVTRSDPGLTTLDDLAAASIAPDGTTPLRILRGAGRMSERDVERNLKAAQLLALQGRYAHASVSFGPREPEGALGTDLAVGTAESLLETLDLSPLGPIDGPRVAVLPSSRTHPPVLVVTGREEGELDAAIAELERTVRQGRAMGSPQGLRALADVGGRRVEGGERVALRDLGLAGADFAGRSFRMAFDLRLPHDVLLADYDRVTLALAGRYAEGLAAGAQLRIEVNGREAASIALARARGEEFRHSTVFLPLSRFRAGHNRVAIIATLPTSADAACAEATGPHRTRFELFDGTEIAFPRLARIARLPDLAHLSVGAFPYAVGAARPILQVTTPDRDTMAAAATLVVQLARVVGAPVPFAFRTGRTVATGPTLLVSPAPSLDPDLLRRLNLDPDLLRRTWESRAARRAPAPADPRRDRRDDAVPTCFAQGATRRAQSVSAPAGSEPATAVGLFDAVSYVRSAEDVLKLPLVLQRAAWGPGSGFAEDLEAASVLALQGPADASERELVTIVSAPTPAALRDGAICLVDPRVWSELAGQLSLVDGRGVVRSTAAESMALVETRPLTVGNTRRIAAGWLSLNPGAYALLALLSAALLALSTSCLLAHVGRRSR